MTMRTLTVSPRARRALLVAYYVGILAGLVLMYGINPPAPPRFIYQGF